MGTSLIASDPPTMAQSIWPAAMASAAVVSACRLVAQARTTVYASMSFGSPVARPTSRAMRQIVCDFARKRLREREHVDREADPEQARGADDAGLAQARQFVALDVALGELAKVNERQSRVIDCRFFAGLSEDETAHALDVGLRTVQRDWSEARAWLAQNLVEA